MKLKDSKSVKGRSMRAVTRSNCVWIVVLAVGVGAPAQTAAKQDPK